MVTKYQDKLAALAERLLEKEVIFKDDLVEILGERPFPEKSIDGEESKSAEEKVTVDTDDKPSSEKEA